MREILSENELKAWNRAQRVTRMIDNIVEDAMFRLGTGLDDLGQVAGGIRDHIPTDEVAELYIDCKHKLRLRLRRIAKALGMYEPVSIERLLNELD